MHPFCLKFYADYEFIIESKLSCYFDEKNEAKSPDFRPFFGKSINRFSSRNRLNMRKVFLLCYSS